MRRSEITDRPKVRAYDQPTGGWGSMKSLLEKSFAENVSKTALWGVLSKQNKTGGVMCVSCSWAKPAGKDAHLYEFCENGAKATIWEMTEARTGRDFFARHRVSELLDWTDYDLEKSGRLTSPMRYDASLDQYVPVTWESAFAEIGKELKALDPKSVIFYASGRASLETSFMYQLLARIYGNQNLPDSSNMCHESTSVGLKASIGSPVGTVTLEDFDHTDMMFFFGHNTGTNAPRLLHQLQEVRKRGAPVVTFNPIEERGLMRFKSPQNPAEMLSPGPGTKMSSDYLQLKCGGDIAAMTGIAKTVLALDDEAKASGGPRVLDVDFIEAHCDGFAEFEAFVRGSEWAEIEHYSGLSREDLEDVGRTYSRANAVIAHYGMGLTQHRHGVKNVQMLVNLMLMRGNVGKKGAGLSPIRGHSNVQGQRTVGITEKTELVPVEKFEQFYGFQAPREKGLATVEACEGVLDGSVKAFIGLGGNFVRAIPETELMEGAWGGLRLHVEIATKLNRSHLVPGEVTYLLPCLGRTELDHQATGDQWVSIEDSTATIHGSFGFRPPASPELLSEPKIVAEIAKATIAGKSTIPWDEWVGDYSRVRDEIERCYPEHFKDFNARFRQPGGFHRDIKACYREWETESGKANFVLPDGFDANPDVDMSGENVFRLMTLRSNDQFNTTVYGYDDRLRGVWGSRMVLLMNGEDMQRLGLRDQDLVDVRTHVDDGVERRVEALRVHSFKLPKGDVGGYFPELNKLIPLWHHAEESLCPAAKCVPVEVTRSAVQHVEAPVRAA
ncbi:FdhF/YdeP family oxidoreductase [Aureimonas mangrovi]|uniref:FdhF/YdeP family oxidoreductase n=1 Tax=Aureimonas mangrovi TaxID=2758041 RepID=UPI00163D70E9|nr:FdhF/YdeP family oxidoreductase [Aureimonas mangrovi]